MAIYRLEMDGAVAYFSSEEAARAAWRSTLAASDAPPGPFPGIDITRSSHPRFQRVTEPQPQEKEP